MRQREAQSRQGAWEPVIDSLGYPDSHLEKPLAIPPRASSSDKTQVGSGADSRLESPCNTVEGSLGVKVGVSV